MTEQPTALRLADALDERRVTRWVHSTGDTPRHDGLAVDVECAQAAAELRRLHNVNAQLLEALCCARDMVVHPVNLAFIDAAIAAAREKT